MTIYYNLFNDTKLVKTELTLLKVYEPDGVFFNYYLLYFLLTIL